MCRFSLAKQGPRHGSTGHIGGLPQVVFRLRSGYEGKKLLHFLATHDFESALPLQAMNQSTKSDPRSGNPSYGPKGKDNSKMYEPTVARIAWYLVLIIEISYTVWKR